MIAVSPKCIIDGSFPDYRRVVPRKLQPCMVGFFSPIQLKALAEIGQELYAHANGGKKSASTGGTLALFSQVGDAPHQCPALVRWVGHRYAYGVLMPTVTDGTGYNSVPEWADIQPIKPGAGRDYAAVRVNPVEGKTAWKACYRPGHGARDMVYVADQCGDITYELEQDAVKAAFEAAEKAFA
jgi:hypothetical protein